MRLTAPPHWALAVIAAQARMAAASTNLVSFFIILLSVVEGRSSVPAALAAGFKFVHWNGLHLLHRKRVRISYNFQLLTAQERRDLLDGRPQGRGKRDVALRTVLPFNRQACMGTGVHDFNSACRDRFCEPVVGKLQVREYICAYVLDHAEIELFRNEAVITCAP